MRYSIRKELDKRIIVLDGGLGTLIQGARLTEADYRGSRFQDWTIPLKGCNDVLALSSPGVLAGIHESYLLAGADIISTDTFNANAISLADYGLQDHVYDINRAATSLARSVADKFTLSNPSKPRFVAGSMGPTGKSASMSPDVENPGARSVTFDALVIAYAEQARGMIDGGVDIFLVETVFDTLNAKAAIRAIEIACAERMASIPVMVSGTITDQSGRILSGQTVEAFYTSVAHARGLISVGLNCAFGAEQLRPYLAALAKVAECNVSVHPNAGLPNVMGGYDQTPQMMADQVEQYMKEGLVNIVGGCCGTTPAHIALISKLTEKYSPRPVPPSRYTLALSGLERMEVDVDRNFVNIGERTNVAGSVKFARLIREGLYEEALAVARQQVEAGAQVIDVCMDDGLIDGKQAMTQFLNLVAAEPDIARVPVMIDSSDWEVLEAGLKCVQGKSIVNSISLKEGEKEFLRRAKLIHSYGAAAVVMLFDERGQADTYQRKIKVAQRVYELLVGHGFPAQDIIFDPNVLAVATGIEEHNDYGKDFIEAVRWIKKNLKYARVSGGISNFSFALRGNNAVREAMHSAFLFHAISAGLDMGIVNPGMLQIYTDIPADLLELVEDVVLNRRPDAAERLTQYAAHLKKETGTAAAAPHMEWREASVADRIKHAMTSGVGEFVAADTREAFDKMNDPLKVIDTILMPAMEHVGELFGQGKMFLPQVVKSARVMKTAVGVLMPYLESDRDDIARNGGKVLIATVKGDVHDIGKNIVSVVMACNGYQINDLGVMVEAETIVDEAAKWKAEVIGLSGLITPSLEEMVRVVSLLEERGMRIPVIIGGATTSDLHTAVKIAPFYSGPVVHVRDASNNIKVITQLTGPQKDDYIRELRIKQSRLRDEYNAHKEAAPDLRPLSEARRRGYAKLPQSVIRPLDQGRKVFLDYPIKEVVPYIDWRFFFPAWGLKGNYPELLESPEKGEEARKLFDDAQLMLHKILKNKSLRLNAVVNIFPASSIDDDIVVWEDGYRKVVLPQLRNQSPNERRNLSLADYLLEEQVVSVGDFIGLFVVSAGEGLEELTAKYREAKDDYSAIMCKLLADRLAEAFAEVVHSFVRRTLWGFEKGEKPTPEDVFEGKYQGLRFAFGYPACPDHSLKREVFGLLHIDEALPSMSLTENFMIMPGESLCGMIVADPTAQYFAVGRIDNQQLTDYAARRGMSIEQVAKLIPTNL